MIAPRINLAAPASGRLALVACLLLVMTGMDGARAGEDELQGVGGRGDPSAADDRHLNGPGYLVDHVQGDGFDGGP